MVSLVDLKPMSRKVVIGDQTVEVHGVSAEALVHLLSEIPELRLVLAQRQLDQDIIKSLLQQSAHVLAQIIAAGMNKTGNEAEIAAARRLPAGATAMLITAIVECTFPQGVKSFIDGLAGAMEGVGVPVEPIKEAVGKSPAPSSAAYTQDIR